MVGFGVEMVRSGDRLGQRYEVIEQIAAGGMGALWRAHHVQLDVDVALKVVSARAASPASLRRFKHEARAAAKLRSPNIVQVLDYGEFDGQPYLAMELLRGEDLGRRLAREGKLPLHECAAIIDGVAKGVQLAHDAGIVHRDLKPGNIFLERIGDDEVVKILDFGIAKDLEAVADPSSTTSVGVVGSPPYMSPEQVWAKKVGRPADVWAMGVVVFEMVTGRNPFLDDTLAKVFERIIRDPIPKLSAFEPGLAPEVDAFFERALARSPAERIPSAKELAVQFRAAIAGLESPTRELPARTTTEPAVARPRVGRTLRRRGHESARARRVAAIVLGLALVVFGMLLAVSRREEPNTALRAQGQEAHREARTEPPEDDPHGSPLPVAGHAQTSELPAAPRVSSAPPRPDSTTAPKRVEHRAGGSPKTSTPAPPTHPPAPRDPKFGIPLGN